MRTPGHTAYGACFVRPSWWPVCPSVLAVVASIIALLKKVYLFLEHPDLLPQASREIARDVHLVVFVFQSVHYAVRNGVAIADVQLGEHAAAVDQLVHAHVGDLATPGDVQMPQPWAFFGDVLQTCECHIRHLVQTASANNTNNGRTLVRNPLTVGNVQLLDPQILGQCADASVGQQAQMRKPHVLQTAAVPRQQLDCLVGNFHAARNVDRLQVALAPLHKQCNGLVLSSKRMPLAS
jgi:hypothetical protein